MRFVSLKRRSSIVVLAMVLVSFGCKFDEIVQPSTATAGSTIEVVLTISNDTAEESNAWKGLLGILMPEGWDFVSGTYDIGVIGSGAMDTVGAAKWVDSLTQYLDPDVGYKWVAILSETGYLFPANTIYETTLQINVGTTLGDYTLGYLVTQETSGMIGVYDADSMGIPITVTGVTGIYERRMAGTPVAFGLRQNYPNPFNPATKIVYEVPEQADIRLAVYDLTGKEVAVLAEGLKPAGLYEVTFAPGQLSTGMYFYRLSAGSFTETRKMLFIK